MKRNLGFSLVELMCAIVILGVGVVGLTHGISTALRSSKEAEVQTAAALLAAGRIETLRADEFIIAGDDEGECSGGLSLYRWKESIVTTSVDGLFEVTIAVENTETSQVIYELQTLLFDPPIPLTSAEPAVGKTRPGARPGQRRPN